MAFVASGSVKVPIYFSPLKKLVASDTQGNAGDLPKERFYNSYVFYYYENGMRRKRRCPSLEAAKTEATTVAKRLDGDGSQPLDISTADRRIHVQVRESWPHSRSKWMPPRACW